MRELQVLPQDQERALQFAQAPRRDLEDDDDRDDGGGRSYGPGWRQQQGSRSTRHGPGDDGNGRYDGSPVSPP
jgi:hypothetical protein